MNAAFIALGAILIAGVALFLYGRSTIKRANEKRSKEALRKAIDATKETEDDIKDMSDSDLDKHI